MTQPELTLVERLGGYNPPDRTVDDQRQIAQDIMEAKNEIERLQAALTAATARAEEAESTFGALHSGAERWKLRADAAESRLAALEAALRELVRLEDMKERNTFDSASDGHLSWDGWLFEADECDYKREMPLAWAAARAALSALPDAGSAASATTRSNDAGK